MSKLTDFTKYLIDHRGLSSATVKSYSWVVSSFIDHNNNDDKFTRYGVSNYLQSLTGTGTYKRWTAQVLKSYFRFLGVPWPLDRVEMPKYSPPHRKMIPLSDADDALKSITNHCSVEYLVVKIILITGIRRSEVCELLLENFQPPYLKVTLSKSSGRVITKKLDPETIADITTYIKSRKDAQPYLIVNNHGHQLKPEVITQIFYKCFRHKYSPHAGRRSVATWLYNKGKGLGIKELQESMGWKTSTMPLLYIQSDNEEIMDKSIHLNPLNRSE